MGHIQILDCTLRDGGYINDWRFGKDMIDETIEKLSNSNIDILEVGFLKNEPYQEDRSVFNSVNQVNSAIKNGNQNVLYSAMCEVFNPLPTDMLDEYEPGGIEIIRVIVWKSRHDDKGNVVDALSDGYRYCKGIVDKGYKLCVQPARVDQYSDEEFISMLNMFSELNPYAIYVVDSWGTQTTESLLHYMRLADDNLRDNIRLGYHGHNNMLQAMSAAEAMLKEHFDRDIIIDGSVYGIGRGAGNLNLEIIANYLNSNYGMSYDIAPMLEIYDKYLSKIYENYERWGYSVPFYLTAKYNANPNYARYFVNKEHLDCHEIGELLEDMDEHERVLYDVSLAQKVLNRVRDRKRIG